MEYRKGQVFYNEKYQSYYSIKDIIEDAKGKTWFKCYYPERKQWATYDQQKIKYEHKYISNEAGKLLSVLYHTPA